MAHHAEEANQFPMIHSKNRIFIFICVLGIALARPGAAAPRLGADELLSHKRFAAGEVQLANTGKAALAGIVLTEPEVAQKALSNPTLRIQKRGIDRYGRTLVVLYPPEGKISWQEQWLRQGYAVIYDAAPVPAAWRKAEAEARHAQRGSWRRADFIQSTQKVEAKVGMFALVKGVVTRTYKARDAYYVNFGEDWKTDFSLKIPRRAWRSFGEKLEVMPGTTILARGVIVSENGPMIMLSRPEQWEIH
jgi:hypothetical protein